MVVINNPVLVFGQDQRTLAYRVGPGREAAIVIIRGFILK